MGPHLTQSPLSWGLPPYQVASWCMQPFGHNRNGPKIGEGALPPFFVEVERGLHLTQSPELRPSSIPSGILIHAAIWPQQIWAENWVEAVPLWGGGAGSPSNTMWPGSMPTCVPSFILIRPTVWPQCTNVTDRQTDRTDRTDNGLIEYAIRFTNGRPKCTCS